MKKITLLTLLISFCLAVICNDNTGEIALAEKWNFMTGDSIKYAKMEFNDTSWPEISITNTWEGQGYDNYDGFAWYRLKFSIPEGFVKNIEDYGGMYIKYQNADDADELYFNGNLIGATGSLPPNYISKYGDKRKYLIPANLIKLNEKNLIAVRVYDGSGGGGIITDSVTIRPLSKVDLVVFNFSFDDKDWVFSELDEQVLNYSIENKKENTLNAKIVLDVITDDSIPIGSFTKDLICKENTIISNKLNFNLPSPGFYKCKLYLKENGVISDPHVFNLGSQPEKIISPSDKKEDFDSFWKKTREELDAVNPNYKTTLLEEHSKGTRNIYHVEMMSFGNVKIEGYYAEPKKAGKYPVIMRYMGYGAEPYMMGSDDLPDFAEFILSVRGQGIQKKTNTYGDWIIYGLENKENYYYRGAFMDLIRAIDFVCTREKVDTSKIGAEGGSQGGAFTLAACALDKRIKAGAPSIPFLSDYRDYFKIVHWPFQSFQFYMQENPTREWDEIYDILTYFDIKNHASAITCPIMMAVGLQDGVCPPHTNFASYNHINSDKKYYIFPENGHNVPNEWYSLTYDFFKEKLELE